MAHVKGVEAPPSMERQRLINRRQLQETIPVSQMTLWRWTRAGAFPAPIRIAGRNYWREDQIRQWLQSQAGTQHGEDPHA